MTISDERLREITQTFPDGDAGKMAEELLQRREAERKANSWDGAPEWALSRQRVTETFCYTDALPDMFQGNARRSYLSREAMGKVEERPK
jgi:hypothetical protein